LELEACRHSEGEKAQNTQQACGGEGWGLAGEGGRGGAGKSRPEGWKRLMTLLGGGFKENLQARTGTQFSFERESVIFDWDGTLVGLGRTHCREFWAPGLDRLGFFRRWSARLTGHYRALAIEEALQRVIPPALACKHRGFVRSYREVFFQKNHNPQNVLPVLLNTPTDLPRAGRHCAVSPGKNGVG